LALVAQGGEVLTADAVEAVLEEVRPFLQMAGGTIELKSLTTTGLAPTAMLLMVGEGAALTSVKVEIQQRLKRKIPALVNVMWDER
jgi:Fe-S cluster biogenesis protein NfuA